MTTRALATRRAGTLQRRRALLGPTLTSVITVGSALALASTLVLVCALVIVAMRWLFAVPAVRRGRARRAAVNQRRVRRHLREHALEVADMPTSTLSELADLVEGLDPDASDARELEPLLDRYVELALARQRCWSVLRYASVGGLQERLEMARMFHPVTAEVLERRVRDARKLDARAHELDDSLDELADFIRCYAERASLPEVIPDELDPIATALERLDAADALG